MHHKSFELEFANLPRKTIKAWFENGMIKPAKREWTSLTYNLTIKNNEV